MYHDAVQGLAFGVYTDAFAAMVVKCIVLVREVTGARLRPCITNAIAQLLLITLTSLKRIT
jgi:hypothetical protein